MAQIIIPKEQEKPDFFYFAEQTSPNAEDVKSFDYSTKKNGSAWWLEFQACVHLFEIMNRNTRQYLGDNIMEMIFSDKNKSLMAHNGWYGEQDHPSPLKEGEKLTRKRVRSIYMPNRSHKLNNPVRKGNACYMDIQTCSGTEAGRGFANEIIQGLIPQFSCRSTGELKIVNRKPTVIANNVITYDWVLYPGFDGAQMTSSPKTKQNTIMTESADDTQSYMGDLAIPFSEFADDLAEGDENVQTYMEAFGPDAKIVGANKSEAVIKSDNMYVYAGLNKDSVDKVRDFYSSFGL